MKYTIPTLMAGCLMACSTLVAADVVVAEAVAVTKTVAADGSALVEEDDVLVIAIEATPMEVVKWRLAQLQGLVSTANASLQMMKQNADPAAVAQLKSLVGLMDDTKEAARRNAIVMEVRATEHYDAWLDQIEGMENKSLRKKAQSRYAKVRGEYNKFVDLVNKARKEYVPYVSDIEDIIIYLEADPSSKALKSLSGSISSMKARSESINKRISEVMKQMEVAKAAIPQN